MDMERLKEEAYAKAMSYNCTARICPKCKRFPAGITGEIAWCHCGYEWKPDQPGRGLYAPLDANGKSYTEKLI